MLEDLRDDADFVEDEDLGYEYQESESAAGTQTQFMGMTHLIDLMCLGIILGSSASNSSRGC